MKNTIAPFAWALLPTILLLFAFNLSLNNAQLSGTITNEANLALKNAEIILNKNGNIVFVTHSNANGNYQLNNLNPGSYTLSVSYKNYNAYRGVIQIQEGVLMEKNFVVSESDTIITELNKVEINGRAVY